MRPLDWKLRCLDWILLATGSMLLEDCCGPDLARLQPLWTAVGSFNFMAPAWPWELFLLRRLKEQPGPGPSCLQQRALEPLLPSGSVRREALQPGHAQSEQHGSAGGKQSPSNFCQSRHRLRSHICKLNRHLLLPSSWATITAPLAPGAGRQVRDAGRTPARGQREPALPTEAQARARQPPPRSARPCPSGFKVAAGGTSVTWPGGLHTRTLSLPTK